MELMSIILLAIGILGLIWVRFDNIKDEEEFKDTVLCEMDKQRKDIEALKEELLFLENVIKRQ